MAALPYLFAGLQIAAPAAFLGAMVGEFTGAERGMGVLTVRAIRALDVEMTWGIATVPTAVAILAYLAIGALARRVLLEAPPVILAAPSAGGSRRRSRADAALVAALALAGWAGAIWLFALNPFFAKSPLDVAAALIWDPDAAQTRASIVEAAAPAWAARCCRRMPISGPVVGRRRSAQAGAGLVRPIRPRWVTPKAVSDLRP